MKTGLSRNCLFHKQHQNFQKCRKTWSMGNGSSLVERHGELEKWKDSWSSCIRLVVAGSTDTDWMIPASRWYWSWLWRTRTTDTFATCSAVMEFQQRAERLTTDTAVFDGFICLPVRRTCCVPQRNWHTTPHEYTVNKTFYSYNQLHSRSRTLSPLSRAIK